MKNLKETFKDKFNKEIPIELDPDCPTHIQVERMIDLVFEASKKARIESYLVLKHFQFTEEEISDYFERLGKRIEI
jgi:hypothetical protein